MSESRMVRSDDLVGIGEIAQFLEVSRPAVSTWARRFPGFPSPVAQLSMGPVYLMSEVLEWVESRWPGRFSQGREW